MKRIMIVDDHPPVLRVMKLGLEGAGFEVETAKDGSEALDMLRASPPDFLVSDIDMPRMTGKELCLAITEEFPQRVFPIVVLTARTETEHRDWTNDMTNLTFMEKPVSIRRLIAHVQESLSADSESGGD